MKINPIIFKAYDIRGIYPQEINKQSAYLIGRAYIKFLKKKNPQIVIGQDNRFSSSILFKKLAKGMIDSGANVIDIGLSTTPMLYFAVACYGFDGGIQITASHNPSEYNGFKVVRKKAIPISSVTGLKKIQKLTESDFVNLKLKGKIIKKDVLQDYIAFNLKMVEIKKIKPLKIIIDTANAVPGIIVSEILKKIPGKTYHLFKKLDGNFPNHHPDPSTKENLKILQKEVLKKKADLGVAFDGDGDRVVFIDEKGGIISGDLICALMSKFLLKENPGQKILHDLRCSKIVSETISLFDGKPVLSRVGHSFVKEKMRKENILFGGELSGHFYYKNHYFTEAPIFVLLKILQILSETQKSFSKLIKPFKKYFYSGEMNFKVENKEKKIKELKSHYQSGKLLEIDGLRVDFNDWWFLVRPSNTEPVLRLIIEAKSKKLLEQKIKELSSFM